MVSQQSDKIDELDSISAILGRRIGVLKQNEEDRLYGDIVSYDDNIKRINSLPVPTENWNYLTSVPHFIEPTKMEDNTLIKEDYIAVIPTARFIVDSLWSKVKVSRKYFNSDGTIKENLRVMEKWHACLLSDDVRRRWLSDLENGNDVEIYRTFNHETKEVKIYFGQLQDKYLCNTTKDGGGNISFRNSLSVAEGDLRRYVCSRLWFAKSGRLMVNPGNGNEEFVRFINNKCYKYGIGYLKSPLQTRGSRKISSLQINL